MPPTPSSLPAASRGPARPCPTLRHLPRCLRPRTHSRTNALALSRSRAFPRPAANLEAAIPNEKRQLEEAQAERATAERARDAGKATFEEEKRRDAEARRGAEDATAAARGRLATAKAATAAAVESSARLRAEAKELEVREREGV